MIRMFGLILFGSLLSGCRTPQPVLEQANHGVSLIADLERSLEEFRRVETHSLDSRRKAIREQLNAPTQVEKMRKQDIRARIAVSDTRTQKALNLLLSSTDALAEEDAARVHAMAENDKAMAALLTPLPTTKESTSAAQAALAQLGEELDSEVRRDELLQFGRKVKKSIDEAKEKISKAQAEAAQAELNRKK